MARGVEFVLLTRTLLLSIEKSVAMAVAKNQPAPRREEGVARSVELLPAIVAAGVGLLAAGLVAIWLFNPAAKEFSGRTMKFNTAAGLLAAATALGLLSRATSVRERRWGRGFAGAVLLIGGATAIEYLTGWNLGIDERLVADFVIEENRRFPGRMSPIAATCFCLLGLALSTLDVPVAKSRVHWASVFTLPLLLVSLVAIAGYIYGVRDFYQLGRHIRIAWPTATSFLALGIGTLMARPDRGPVRYFANARLSGMAARRLLPAVVVIPLAFGWLNVFGQKNGVLGVEIGSALFAVSLVVVLGVVVWIDARALDVTDQEREKSEGLFRSFFNLGLVGMAESDAVTGKILRANTKMEEITGLSAAELKKSTIDDITHPDDRERGRAAFREMLEGRRPAYTAENRYIRRDGQSVWGIINVAVVRTPPGDRVTFVGVLQDITFLKEAQDKLAAALRVREEFLGVASHELKTPLTALLLQVQGVQRLMGADPALARYESRLARAAAAGLRLQELIHALLDLSRIAEGRLRLETDRFELGSLVEEVVGRFSEVAAPAETLIDVRVEENIFGTWDRLRIDQVVTNLLSNALKYGAGRPIEVTAKKERGTAVIAVRDYGIGIPKAEQCRIFERFERHVGTRSYGGFGLGLWIAREIAVLSGGAIDVESSEGEGSCFTVRLPAETEPRS
jgi:PAS domain S-box-containing protein